MDVCEGTPRLADEATCLPSDDLSFISYSINTHASFLYKGNATIHFNNILSPSHFIVLYKFQQFLLPELLAFNYH